MLAVALTACGSSSGPTVAPAPKTFTVKGHLTLTSGNLDGGYGDGCLGSDGFDDIESGAQVVVKDASGKSVAIGALGDGVKSQKVVCTFPFTVPNVPAGDNVYSIEVTHRGGISFTPDKAGDVDLTLG